MAVGKEVPRLDGPLKVTGTAQYAADFYLKGLVHAVIVGSRIGKGRITAISDDRARRVPGVLAVITHRDRPKFANLKEPPDGAVDERIPLSGTRIDHLGQAVAIVVAETREAAQHAAENLEIRYEKERVVVEPPMRIAQGPWACTGVESTADSGCKCANGAKPAAVSVDRYYVTPFEHHSPMEPSAVVAVWEGDTLILHDSTQWLTGVQHTVAAYLAMPLDKVHVVSRFVGGAFGCKRLTGSHVLLVAYASRMVGRPVALSLSRRQMFTMVGHRPHIGQRLRLQADARGRLVALQHFAWNTTSMAYNFTESITRKINWTYDCPGTGKQDLDRLDLPTPTYMRAPGAAPGFFALESAMDEMAETLAIDPLELRRRNYASVDPCTKKAWGSNQLFQCYQEGAERFGWSARKPAAGSMRDKRGHRLGWGMATALYPVRHASASARVAIDRAGKVTVQCATQEMGCGTSTALAQIAADELGVDVARVTVEIGDTRLPETSPADSSHTLSSIGSAVMGAAASLREKLLKAAVIQQAGPLRGVDVRQLQTRSGCIFLGRDPSMGIAMQDIVAAAGPHPLAASVSTDDMSVPSMRACGAHFVEVSIDPCIPNPCVRRVVSAFAVGHVVNPLLVRSQLLGGIVQGIGMALFEASVADSLAGGFLNTSLGGYLVPTCADVPDIKVCLVHDADFSANRLGAKGVGELGIVGVAGAIANAVYHATGVRPRRLPIRIEDLLHMPA